MSYYICKNISLFPKKNIIKAQIADSSLRPLTFYTFELFNNEYYTNLTFEEKLYKLYVNFMEGNIHPYKSADKGLWHFALLDINNEIKLATNKTLWEHWGSDDWNTILKSNYDHWKKIISLKKKLY